MSWLDLSEPCDSADVVVDVEDGERVDEDGEVPVVLDVEGVSGGEGGLVAANLVLRVRMRTVPTHENLSKTQQESEPVREVMGDYWSCGSIVVYLVEGALCQLSALDHLPRLPAEGQRLCRVVWVHVEDVGVEVEGLDLVLEKGLGAPKGHQTQNSSQQHSLPLHSEMSSCRS